MNLREILTQVRSAPSSPFPMTLKQTSVTPIQPTHVAHMQCESCQHKLSVLAAKVKPPGARRPVWIYPYGLPSCPQCGGSLAKSE